MNLLDVENYKERRNEAIKLCGLIYLFITVGIRLYTGTYFKMINIMWEIGFPVFLLFYCIIIFILHYIYDLDYKVSNKCSAIPSKYGDSGAYGKYLVGFYLNKLFTYKQMIYNIIIYINRANDITEADAVLITKKGIFIIESRNYYAVVEGNTNEKEWNKYTGGYRNSFYNPVYQNRIYRRELKNLLSGFSPEFSRFPVYSVVAFGDTELYLEGELEKDSVICNYNKLPKAIKKLSKQTPKDAYLSRDDINKITGKLLVIKEENKVLYNKHAAYVKQLQKERLMFGE